MPVFLFTDIEGSTKKWELYQDEMKDNINKHDAVIKQAIETHGGTIIKHTGDGVFAVFNNGDPLQASIDIQNKLADEDWGAVDELRVRIGLHAGSADRIGNDYFGPVVNRAARVMGAAWGGQIIITPAVKQCAVLPKNAVLQDAGLHLLKDLGEPQQLFQVIHPDLPIKEFPPLHTLSAHPHNLPEQNTPFLGREAELKEIIRLLEDEKCRLLTLIGPGGIGKTRLALQAAAESIERFTHGVFFIPLDPLSSVDYLITGIAEVLKFKFYSREDEKQQLLQYLRDKELLLIMDNFEHLVEGAGIVGEILRNAHKVKILVTSRELLNLKGEWIIQLQGLEVPAGNGIDIEGYSAVQLFLHNAQRVQRQLTLSEEEKTYVTRICQLVGGLPLGIEIASSWLRSLTCKEIAQEIEKNYDFLATSMRDIPDRHRSLRAVFEYSWNLITAREQDVLKKISIFCGGFTREAAEAIADASVAALASLTDKSLLYRDGSGRYRIFEILRQYAEEKLDEKEKSSLLSAHRDYFMEYLHKREDEARGDYQIKVFNEMRDDLENIRAAFEGSVKAEDVELLDKAAISIYYLFNHYGWLHDGESLINKVLTLLGDKTDDRARHVYFKYLQRYAAFSYALGNFKEAREQLNQCREFFHSIHDESELAQVFMSLGSLEIHNGNYDEAVNCYQNVLDIFEDRNDQANMAGILNNIGVIHYYKREYDKASEMFNRCLDISKELEHKKSRALALGNLGIIAQEKGNYEEALKNLNESMQLEQEGGDTLQNANTLNNLGEVYLKTQQYDKAKEVYTESLRIRQEAGDLIGISMSLYNLGELMKQRKQYDDAMSYYTRSYDIRKEIGAKRYMAESILRRIEILLICKRYKEAETALYEGLNLGVESTYKAIIHEALVGFARIEYAAGRKQKAFEIMEVIVQEELYNEDVQVAYKTMMKSLQRSLTAKSRAVIKKRMAKKTYEDVVKILLVGNKKATNRKEGDV